jgi:hypothetical protein
MNQFIFAEKTQETEKFSQSGKYGTSKLSVNIVVVVAGLKFWFLKKSNRNMLTRRGEIYKRIR